MASRGRGACHLTTTTLSKINQVMLNNHTFYQTLLCYCDLCVASRILISQCVCQSENFAYTSVTLALQTILLEPRLFQVYTEMESDIRNTPQLLSQANAARSMQTLTKQASTRCENSNLEVRRTRKLIQSAKKRPKSEHSKITNISMISLKWLKGTREEKPRPRERGAEGRRRGEGLEPRDIQS